VRNKSRYEQEIRHRFLEKNYFSVIIFLMKIEASNLPREVGQKEAFKKLDM
jgi:hypothetical protein